MVVGGAVLPYRVEWRDVRYPRLEFKTEQLLVVLPKSWEDETPLLERKMDWISRKCEEIRKAIERVRSRARQAKGMLIFGDFFDVRAPSDASPKVDFGDKVVECDLSNKRQLRRLASVLRKRLLQELRQAAERYCEKFGVRFNRIYIKNQKTKWASCSSRGNLSFNFWLICLPRELIEYVVCHEVLHLKEKRHNAAFWEALGREFGDYKEKERSLFEYWFFVQEQSRSMPLPVCKSS